MFEHCTRESLTLHVGDPNKSLSGLRDSIISPMSYSSSHSSSSSSDIISSADNTTFFSSSVGFDFSESTSAGSGSASDICSQSQGITFIVLSTVFVCITIFLFGTFAFAYVPPLGLLIHPSNTPHREYGFEQRRREKKNIFAHTLSRLNFFIFLLKTLATLYVQFSGEIRILTRAALYQWVLMAFFAALCCYIVYFMPFYKRVANMLYLSLFSIWY